MAYNAIKTRFDNGMYVTLETWSKLMLKLNDLSKRRSEAQIRLLWRILDENNKGYIGR